MGLWFNQANEITALRREVKRQAEEIQILLGQLRAAGMAPEGNPFGVSEEEAALARDGKVILAIKQYRDRTGLDLATAKYAIDSVR